MTPERWRQITDVFHAALARDTAARRAFLDEACASDRALRDEVDAMLASHGGAGQFGEQPVRLSTIAVRRLEPGAVVGPYRIDGLIGAGGMGEVYRAHDSRIGREVAIKVLPADYAADGERLRRFEQEARLVGSLNHPNLVTLYDVGTADGQPYLVTELLDGETLRDRISRGPVPASKACELAADVARGLAAAHAKGIVHRDLKPENVMVTRDGRVKILDFGIAKLRPPEAGPEGPTAPTPLNTAPDMVLGTAGYMAPEQVRGLPADERADLFALGAILFELLTGRRAFDRDSRVETLNAILHDDPPELDGASAALPDAVERIVRRCLEKDPDARFQSARDLAFALETAAGGSPVSRPGAAPVRSRRSIGLREAATVVLAASAVTAFAVWRWVPRGTAAARQVTRLVVQPPAATDIFAGFDISPDGSLLVFSGRQAGVSQLFLRRLDQLDAVAMPGTEGGALPFFSPDGRFVGFVAGGKIKKISLTSAAEPVVLCDVTSFHTATWATDDAIIYASVGHGLQRVSAEGGRPQALTTPDRTRHEVDHHNPVLLPGGKALLYTIHDGTGLFRIAAQSLATGERKLLVDAGFDARYSPTGHLVYANRRSLFAVPFNLERVEVTGDPVKLIDEVATSTESARGNFSVSASGTLVLVPAPPRTGRTLVWVDRAGAETPLPLQPRLFTQPRLSPDGQRLAVVVVGGERDDIWIHDVATRTFSRVTLEGSNRAPLWTRDGLRLTYASEREGANHLFWQPTDGSSPPESLISSRNNLFAAAWLSDGRSLVYVDSPPTDRRNISLLSLADGRRVQSLMNAPTGQDWPTLSPDGRWLAFVSFETGRAEVYVQPFPGPGPRRQLTVDGATEPVWSRDGRELFYRNGGRGSGMDANAHGIGGPAGGVYALSFDSVRGVPPGGPVPLFRGRYAVSFAGVPGYDVTPDGRFVMVKPSEEELAPPRLHVVVNWLEELKRLVPTR